MTYTANIPLSGQSLGNSRPIINSNFQQIQNVFSLNHSPFNSATQGNHTTIISEVTTLDPALSATEMAFYAKSLAGLTEYWVKNGFSNAQYKLTGPNPGTVAAGADTQYNTFLPGGVLVFFGSHSTNNPGPSSTLITFNPTTPGFSQTPIILTGLSTTGALGFGSIDLIVGTNVTTAGFKLLWEYDLSIFPHLINWIAIGV